MHTLCAAVPQLMGCVYCIEIVAKILCQEVKVPQQLPSLTHSAFFFIPLSSCGSHLLTFSERSTFFGLRAIAQIIAGKHWMAQPAHSRCYIVANIWLL